MTIRVDKWPPKLSANQAFDIVYKINSAYGKRVNRELLPEILDSTIKSSNFGKRILALQTFGLVSSNKEVVQLTDLALQLVTPVSTEEQTDAMLRSFDFHPVLRELRERYPGGHLPDPTKLENLLAREYSIPEESVMEWVDFITDSFRAISSIPSRGIVKTIGTVEEHDYAMPIIPVKSSTQDYQTLKLPEGRSVTFPMDMTDEELDLLVKFVQGYKTLSGKK